MSDEEIEWPTDWEAIEVLPGTKYDDAPNTEVQPGWYVRGGEENPGEDGPRFVIRIEYAVDKDDELLDEDLADRIADLLNRGVA